jgi:hypothetical protein
MVLSDGIERSRRGDTLKPGTNRPSALGKAPVFGKAVPGVCAVATLKHDKNNSQQKIRTFEKLPESQQYEASVPKRLLR